MLCYFFFFSSRRRHTRYWHDWSSDVCSSDLKIKAKSPQTNGICERFNRTVQNEFYAIAFRKKIYTTIEQLQTDLDTWMNSYNTERTDRKSTRLNSSHANISYAVFCLKKKNNC